MPTRILVAVDASEREPGVFDAAAELAQRFDATLFVVRAVTVSPEFPAGGGRERSGSFARAPEALRCTGTSRALEACADAWAITIQGRRIRQIGGGAKLPPAA
jgi:hypothetical protein